MRQIKDIVRGMREDRDLTQTDIAKVLGVNQQYYSKYENGEYEIPCRHIITLCKFYGITADYLLGLIEHEFPIGNSAFEYGNKPIDTKKIMQNFDELNQKDKLFIAEYINLVHSKLTHCFSKKTLLKKNLY